jgi:transcriptional antiterminator NusG
VIDKPNQLAQGAAVPSSNDEDAADKAPELAAAEPVVDPVEEQSGETEVSPPAAEMEAQPVAEASAADEPEEEKNWYILKVQSNRENSVADALRRRVTIEGLDDYFGQVIVPTEKVTEFKGGKKRVVHRKLYPGYILVEMVINDDTWFLVRETPGIGDFTGAGGKPTPMLPHEVQRIVAKQEEKTDAAPKLKVSFSTGDRVKINEGTFESFEGEVSRFDQTSGHVTVMINIFGRSTPVELEYWQIERI